MKKIFLSAAFIGSNVFLNSSALNAQNIGLQWQNIKPKTTASANKNNVQDYAPQLRLPKVANPLSGVPLYKFSYLNVQQQAALDKSGFSNHYRLINNQTNMSQSDVFGQNLIDAAFSKLFGRN